MKKHLLLTAALFIVGTMCMTAQNYKKYSFANRMFATESGDSMQILGYFSHVSANGKYAVGTDLNFNYFAYMWSKEYPDSLININSTANRISAFDVTNDGTIVGGYENRKDMSEEDIMYPAYRTPDGVWHKLPVHKNASEYYMKTSTEYMNTVRAVTPDGKFMAGQGHVKIGQKWVEAMHKYSDVTTILPYLWERNGDEITMTAFDNLAKNSLYYNESIGAFYQKHDSVSVDFVVYDISDDGKTIAGVNFAESGGQNPAFIRDGKLYQFFDCGEEMTPIEERNFNGGMITSIDSNGNMYGYYVDDEAVMHYFQYTADNKFVMLDEMVIAVAANGTKLTKNVDLYSPLDISNDGSVIVGGGTTTLMGAVVNAPELLWDSYNYDLANNVQLKDCQISEYAVVDSTITLSGTFANVGSTVVENIKVVVYADGTEVGAEIVDGLYLNPSNAGNFALKNISFKAEGDFDVWMEITEVNGTADADPSNNVSGVQKVICRNSFVKRNVLLEVFSTESCTNCPNAHKYINEVLEGYTNVIEVGHHSGYYTDWLTVGASEDYLWFYGGDYTFAPAMMVDRTSLYEKYPQVYLTNSPILDVTDVLPPLLDLARNSPAQVELGLSATFDEPTYTLELTVKGKQALDLANDTTANLTVFLTEDSVLAQSQAGAGAEYYHRHALRMCLTPSWGDSLGVIKEGFEKTYTAVIPKNMMVDKMQAVAFVSNRDAEALDNNQVYNAAALDLKTLVSTGIANVQTAGKPQILLSGNTVILSAPAQSIAVYDATGRCLAATDAAAKQIAIPATKGMMIVKAVVDGKQYTRKVVR